MMCEPTIGFSGSCSIGAAAALSPFDLRIYVRFWLMVLPVRCQGIAANKSEWLNLRVGQSYGSDHSHWGDDTEEAPAQQRCSAPPLPLGCGL
jgi:hypothetical protein